MAKRNCVGHKTMANTGEMQVALWDIAMGNSSMNVGPTSRRAFLGLTAKTGLAIAGHGLFPKPAASSEKPRAEPVEDYSQLYKYLNDLKLYASFSSIHSLASIILALGSDKSNVPIKEMNRYYIFSKCYFTASTILAITSDELGIPIKKMNEYYAFSRSHSTSSAVMAVAGRQTGLPVSLLNNIYASARGYNVEKCFCAIKSSAHEEPYKKKENLSF